MTPERLEAAAAAHMDIHLMESFAHAGQCENLSCQRKCCVQLMQVATHAKSCALIRPENSYKCHLCRQVLPLCAIHLENCQNAKCFIPFCKRYKKCRITPIEERRCKATAAGITFEIRIGFSKQEVINFNIFRKYINRKYEKVKEKFPIYKERECEKSCDS
ncbi:histone lysine acetyltransferase CREBBP-like [Planococcus citri]|uniref:histone lysine acetyltransferase CREBBP-like n=1 Tax=Planococcus citri TaxID=170843 RepID=UPI0031F97379